MRIVSVECDMCSKPADKVETLVVERVVDKTSYRARRPVSTKVQIDLCLACAARFDMDDPEAFDAAIRERFKL